VSNPATNPLRLTLAELWSSMSRRNDWALVDDLDAFLSNTESESQLLACLITAITCLKLAIKRCYGQILYTGLTARRERAAQELWAACYRAALRSCPPTEAEEVAQETITRVLEKLPTLRDPRSLILWAIRIQARLIHELQQRTTKAGEPLAQQHAEELIDPTELDELVITQLGSSRLLDLARQIIRNQLELNALLRFALLDEKPGDTAIALGVKPTQARVAKSRALQHLRASERFMAELRAIAGETAAHSQDAPAESTLRARAFPPEGADHGNCISTATRRRSPTSRTHQNQ
jgi:DNA-directed RNA polymerase specialized sigma24 family protein